MKTSRTSDHEAGRTSNNLQGSWRGVIPLGWPRLADHRSQRDGNLSECRQKVLPPEADRDPCRFTFLRFLRSLASPVSVATVIDVRQAPCRVFTMTCSSSSPGCERGGTTGEGDAEDASLLGERNPLLLDRHVGGVPEGAGHFLDLVALDGLGFPGGSPLAAHRTPRP